MKWTASAPGRLDVMGGIADYSGSLVLQMPIDEEATCDIRPRDDRLIVVESDSRPEPIAIQLDRLIDGDLADYSSARSFFADPEDRHWAAYVIGVVLVLIREEELVPPTGFSISVRSEVPEGKGVSSSAALEVATMRSLLVWLDRSLDPTRVALLCQLAENRVAGAPCGIMDQMAASSGKRGQLLRILCQPAELQGLIALPDGMSVWGVDSGIRHSVSGSEYGDVRTAAFMGLRIIEDHADASGASLGGYLANLDPSTYMSRFRAALPETITGQDFLERYATIADHVVKVDAGRTYSVRACTAHPIFEHDRIQRFAELLEEAGSGTRINIDRLADAGALMYESHAGYGTCGLGSAGTDRLVELVKGYGPDRGLFGARITGGGSGGTVAILGLSASLNHVEELASRYEHETGRKTQIFQSIGS